MATSFHKVNNNAASTLNAAIDDNDLSLAVPTGEGAEFDTVAQYLTLGRSDTYNGEILDVASRSSDTFTVTTRGVDGTTATAHDAGDRVECLLVAAHITEIQDAINAIENGTVFLAQVKLSDDTGKLIFGADSDIQFYYDEATDDRLEITDGTNILAYLKDLGTTGLFGVTGRIECPQIGISADTDLLALAANALTVNGAISQNSTFTSTVATQWILSHQPASGAGSIRFSPLPVTTSDAASVDFFRLSNSTVFSSFCLFLGDGTSKKSFEHRIGSAAPNTAWYAADGSTVMAQIFNLTGNATFAGAVTAASDTDSTHILGRARIHSATSDRAMFAHFDRSASNQYAISHFAGGDLQVNGASSIAFQIAATTEMTLSATDLTFSDAFNLIFNATTGTKFATATSQKIGFWNATPIIQPASANQAALSLDVDVTGGDTVDKAAINTNFTNIQTLVNQLRSDLVAAGLIKGAA